MMVKDTELAAAAAMFPPVSEICRSCNGEGRTVTGTASPNHEACKDCGETGRVVRRMADWEEHAYLMILLQGKADGG